MKYLFILLLGFTLLSCSTAVGQENVDVMQFETILKQDKKVVLLDVRTPEEYAQGHIENSININYYDAAFSQKVEELVSNKNAKVLVYCRSGGRSSSAVSKLDKLGYTSLVNLKGGFSAWSSAFPTNK